MISKSNMCRFVKVQSRKLNTRKEREKEIEENNKLPWSLSSMYRCVCVMQSSSIERNDTLNCNIERLFFLFFGINRVMWWCAKTMLRYVCVCMSMKAKVMNKRSVQWVEKKKKREEGRKENWPSHVLFSDFFRFYLRKNDYQRREEVLLKIYCDNRNLIENRKYRLFSDTYYSVFIFIFWKESFARFSSLSSLAFSPFLLLLLTFIIYYLPRLVRFLSLSLLDCWE